VPAGQRSDARRLNFYKPRNPGDVKIGRRRHRGDEGEPVGTVIMHNVVSVDGFIADKNADVGRPHEWYFSRDTPITAGGDQTYAPSGTGARFKVSSASAEYVRPMWESIGATVMG